MFADTVAASHIIRLLAFRALPQALSNRVHRRATRSAQVEVSANDRARFCEVCCRFLLGDGAGFIAVLLHGQLVWCWHLRGFALGRGALCMYGCIGQARTALSMIPLVFRTT